MAVEIFIEPELEEMTHSTTANDEWKKKVKELGLEGQQKLIKSESSNPSPYTFMNEKMTKVFSVLCPSVVNYKNYSKSTIPLDVLCHIALCEKEGYFDKMKIWYDDKSPDPILVGYIKDGDYSFNLHIIARWGDEILPMETLEMKAIKRIQELMKSKFKGYLNNIESSVFDFFNPTDRNSGKLGFEHIPVTYSHRN